MTATAAHEHTAHCLRCGRKLTSAKAVKIGYGAKCATRIRKALPVAGVGFKAEQVEKAQELIETGAVIPMRGRRIFKVVGSKGEIYRTAATNCNCPAGLRGRRCYHVLTVRAIAA
jgi:hypothetical protein